MLLTACPTNMAADKLVAALTGSQQGGQLTFGTATVSLQTRRVEKRLFGHTTAELEAQPGEGVFGVVKEDGSFLLLEHGGQLPLDAGDSVVYSCKID